MSASMLAEWLATLRSTSSSATAAAGGIRRACCVYTSPHACTSSSWIEARTWTSASRRAPAPADSEKTAPGALASPPPRSPLPPVRRAMRCWISSVTFGSVSPAAVEKASITVIQVSASICAPACTMRRTIAATPTPASSACVRRTKPSSSSSTRPSSGRTAA